MASVDSFHPVTTHQRLFLPLAVKKLRSCPFWRGIVADEEVEAGYRNALALLDEGDPGKTIGFTFNSPY